MPRSLFVKFGFLSLLTAFPASAFALDDGWYHAVDVQPNCGLLAEAVLFIESDKPISGTIRSESYVINDPKKISNKKIIMDVGNSSQIGKVEFSKKNSNQILAKIIAANACIGSIVTLSK